VLNPLTNTDIIGNVLYFLVKSKNIDPASTGKQIPPAPQSPHLMEKLSPGPMRSPVAENQVLINLQVHCGENASPYSAKAKSPGGWSMISIPNRQSLPNLSENSGDEDSGDEKRKLILSMNSDTAHSPTTKSTEPLMGWTLAQAVSCIAPESIPSVVVTTSTNTAVNTITNTGNKSPEGKSKATKRPQTRPGSPLKIQTQLDRPKSNGGSDLLRLKSPGAAATAVKTPVHGVPSQFGNLLSPQQASAIAPPSARGRRRPFSYMNSLITSGDRDASLNDWCALLESDRESAPDSPDGPTAGEDNDTVKPFKNMGDRQSPVAQPVEFYDAILFATDSDFLEQSACRATFKANAINMEEAQLLEMAPFNGEPETVARDASGVALNVVNRTGGIFELIGSLFYDWRSWTMATWVLTIMGLLAFCGVLAAIFYSIFAILEFGRK
jgi:hypothetical protein